MAYAAHKADRAIFDQALVDSAGCSPEAAMELGLLVNHRQTQVGRRRVSQYSFRHLTIQEFLVAVLPRRPNHKHHTSTQRENISREDEEPGDGPTPSCCAAVLSGCFHLTFSIFFSPFSMIASPELE